MVKHPYMRMQLILTIRSLADADYQRKVWVNLESPRDPWFDDADVPVHVLLDDMDADIDLDGQIGFTLENDTEAEAVMQAAKALNVVLEGLPGHASAEMYINSPHWPAVVAAARHAYGILTGGQDPDGMFEDLAGGWMMVDSE